MKQTARQLIRYSLFLALIGVTFYFLQKIPLDETQETIQDWIDDAGSWGYLWYFLIGTVLSVVFCPISPIIFSAGLLFGFWLGLGLAIAVLAAGAVLGFLLGGKLWDRISHLSFAQNRWFRAIHSSVRDDGVTIVALLRMTPFLQFTLANFFFGTLSLKLLPFTLASILGMLPGAVLMVYAGTLTRSTFGGSGDLGIWQWAL
ncbi:MAG: TVP38/TMEM64 family protein, partial [Puniceicoccales bacterium]